MGSRLWAAYRAITLAAAGLLALVLWPAGVSQAQDSVQMAVVTPEDSIGMNENFTVDIKVDNVENLAAFQFTLSYDSTVIKYVEVKEGPFLASSGREPQCPEPRVKPGSPETLDFNCVTLGPPPSHGGKAGASGSGVLATVTFSGIDGGKSDLALSEGRLVAAEINAEGAPQEIETAVVGGSVEVSESSGGVSWAILGPVIGVVGIVIVGGAALVAARVRASRNRPSIRMD